MEDRMSAFSITKALRGRWHVSYGMARCPVHEDGTPSLKITDDPRKTDGIDVICFAGCRWQDVKAELRRQALIGDFDPYPHRPRRSKPPHRAPDSEPEPDEEALAIWRAALSLDDTLAEGYLTRHRGLSGSFPPSLRFIPSLHPGTRLAFPGLVAAVQRPDRRIIAVQVTYLRPSDGAKATASVPRLTFGALGTGMIRLAHAGAELGIAEGTETALAALELTGVPTWAVLGAQRLAKVTIPAGVRHLHIFADNDPPGLENAKKAADRYTREGLRVTVRCPPDECKDYNDMLRGHTRQVTAEYVPAGEAAV